MTLPRRIISEREDSSFSLARHDPKTQRAEPILTDRSKMTPLFRWPPAISIIDIRIPASPRFACVPFRHNETNETNETNASERKRRLWRGTL